MTSDYSLSVPLEHCPDVLNDRYINLHPDPVIKNVFKMLPNKGLWDSFGNTNLKELV